MAVISGFMANQPTSTGPQDEKVPRKWVAQVFRAIRPAVTPVTPDIKA